MPRLYWEDRPWERNKLDPISGQTDPQEDLFFQLLKEQN
jgi:hypothetical protein